MKTVWLTVGFAAGYVLGARAGRERYEQIARASREFLNTPEVAEAKAKVKQVAEQGREAVRAKFGLESDHDVDTVLPASGMANAARPTSVG
jgi:hypothetical protein